MLKLAALIILFTLVAVPAATVNQLYCLNAIAGDAGLKNGTVILDPPLTMTRDTSGRVHIGFSAPPVSVRVFSAVTSDDGLLPVIDSRALVYRNGLLQSPGIDYDVVLGAVHFRPGMLAAGDQIEVATLP